MTRWKRLDLLIDAFAEVHRHHRVRLLIAGEGAGRSQAVEHIRRRGLENDAATLGWVDDPQDCAARAWAFVLASDEEGFAQVLTEAMSAGCPVITTDAEGGGPRYVTDGGRYGLLVPRGDTAALADAMARLLQPTVREKYAALGLQRAAYFSPRACAGALVTFLDEHLGLTA